MKFSTKLTTGMTFTAVLPAVVVIFVIGWFSIQSSRTVVESLVEEKLVGLREVKKQQIQNYFRIIRNQILTFSNDRMIIDAMKGFKHTFFTYGNEVDAEDVKSLRHSLSDYYQHEFGEVFAKMNNSKDAGAQELLEQID